MPDTIRRWQISTMMTSGTQATMAAAAMVFQGVVVSPAYMVSATVTVRAFLLGLSTEANR